MHKATVALNLERGTPPAESYWIGCDRAELARRIAARRPQQSLPSTKLGAFWDSGIEAEQSLRAKLALCRLRAEQRRAEVERARRSA